MSLLMSHFINIFFFSLSVNCFVFVCNYTFIPKLCHTKRLEVILLKLRGFAITLVFLF